jgi:BirA family biotin operon repressor/biotin-[acetyl-CoA-carboxylase] ligase
MFHIITYGSIGSTSDEALRLAREGAAHGTVVIAGEQTAGRGRVGRTWVSPPGNLYMSMLLRLDLPVARMAELSFVAALAVADAVDGFLPGRASLKWPNDVLVDGAKIAGILVEQADGCAIVGIGVNVAHSPAGTAYPVRSLAQPSPCGQARGDLSRSAGEVTIDAVRDAVLGAFKVRLDTWLTQGFAIIRAAWLARAHPPGTRLSGGGTDGIFAGLDADGALLLDTPAGRRRIVGGEVQPR